MQDTPDPELAKALDEIGAVLVRHKIAGAICLASRTHTAFRLRFPDWLSAQMPKDGLQSSAYKTWQGREESLIHLLLALRDLVMTQGVHVGQISSTLPGKRGT